MLKKYFVNQGLKEVQIEEFLKRKFPAGDYSKMELQRTPLGLKIVIYSPTPGRIIGRGGKTINEMTEALKGNFEFENPQLDVKPVANPYLDANAVAKQIALSLERGFNFRRVGNVTLKKVMSAGAIGAEIIISGRASGGKAIVSKFTDGYLKHSGEPSKTLVDYGFEEVHRIGKSKPGKVGIKVKIMKEFQTITGERKSSRDEIEPAKRLQAAREEAAEKEEAAGEVKEALKERPAEGKEFPKKKSTEEKKAETSEEKPAETRKPKEAGAKEAARKKPAKKAREPRAAKGKAKG